VNNLPLDKYPYVCYIYTMMNDMSNPTNHDARISCEEAFTEDMGPAHWANETEHPPTTPEGYELDPVWGPICGAVRPVQPTHKEVAGVCEDAPCCGCCGGSMDDGYGTYADDAWHDANEYPEW
jgi:hypothetical protein